MESLALAATSYDLHVYVDDPNPPTPREVSTHSLAPAATSYDLHVYVDDPNPPTPFNSSTVPLDVLTRIRADTRFDGILPFPTIDNLSTLLAKHEPQLIEYFNSLL